jgi:hypothetical protein
MSYRDGDACLTDYLAIGAILVYCALSAWLWK